MINAAVLSLDPDADKELVEERIAHNIGDQVRGLDEEEVEHAVKEKYEELLEHAKVKQHVPTLQKGGSEVSFDTRRARKGRPWNLAEFLWL